MSSELSAPAILTRAPAAPLLSCRRCCLRRSLVQGLVRGIFDIRSLVCRLTGLSSPWSGFSDFSNHRKDYQIYRCKQDGVEYGHSKVSQNQQKAVNDPRFLEYLQQELGISETEIALANREQQPSVTELPIVLWNYGLIDLEKVGKIFDWIERAAA